MYTAKGLGGFDPIPPCFEVIPVFTRLITGQDGNGIYYFCKNVTASSLRFLSCDRVLGKKKKVFLSYTVRAYIANDLQFLKVN